MTALDDHLVPPADDDSGCDLLLQLASAVTHLRRGLQPGLTVWEVLATETRGAAGIPLDPNRLRIWLTATAQIYNHGHPWPAFIWADSLLFLADDS